VQACVTKLKRSLNTALNNYGKIWNNVLLLIVYTILFSSLTGNKTTHTVNKYSQVMYVQQPMYSVRLNLMMNIVGQKYYFDINIK
jgi:hypothetical protein